MFMGKIRLAGVSVTHYHQHPDRPTDGTASDPCWFCNGCGPCEWNGAKMAQDEFLIRTGAEHPIEYKQYKKKRK